MGRWLAGRLIKEPGLVSCWQPTFGYRRGGREHVESCAKVRRNRAKPGVVRRRDVYLER